MRNDDNSLDVFSGEEGTLSRSVAVGWLGFLFLSVLAVVVARRYPQHSVDFLLLLIFFSVIFSRDVAFSFPWDDR
jgi:hypothetical protein